MTNSEMNPSATSELGYGQIFSVLLRRRLWFLGVFGSALGAALLLTLLERPKYESSMQMLVEPNYQSQQEPQELSRRAESKVDAGDYATQLNLMRSGQFMQKVVEELNFEYPDLQPGAIARSLKLSQVTEDDTSTQIFQASYVDSTPQRAKRVLEALQKVYQDYNLEQQEQRLSRGLAAITKQLQEARTDLARSQGELEQFLGKNGLAIPEKQAESILQLLTEVRQERQLTVAQYEQNQALYAALQKQVAMNPQTAMLIARVSQSTRYQTLFEEFQKTELELASARTTYTDNAPNVQRLLDQRQRQLNLLNEEVRRLLQSSPGQVQAVGEDANLITEVEFSKTDLDLVSRLLEAQSNSVALSARKDGLQKIEQQLQTELNRFPGLIAQYERLQPEVESERENIQQLLSLKQRASAEIAQGGFYWQVVEAPKEGMKISPQPQRNLLMGAVLGLFLGGIAAFLRESLDNVLRAPEDVEQQLNVPMFGVLPQLPAIADDESFIHAYASAIQPGQGAEDATAPWIQFRESLDLIYKNILITLGNITPQTIAVTSAKAGEGRSTVAVGLAMSAARLHQKVLLIDADLRQPSIHEFFKIPNDHGLSSLFSKNFSGNRYPIQTPLKSPRVDVLTAGPMYPDPIRLLSSTRMKDLMLALWSHYDLIILDSPATLGKVDMLQVASICTATVLVTRLDEISKSDLTEAVSTLSKFNLIGAIASQSPKATTRFHLPRFEF